MGIEPLIMSKGCWEASVEGRGAIEKSKRQEPEELRKYIDCLVAKIRESESVEGVDLIMDEVRKDQVVGMSFLDEEKGRGKIYLGRGRFGLKNWVEMDGKRLELDTLGMEKGFKVGDFRDGLEKLVGLYGIEVGVKEQGKRG